MQTGTIISYAEDKGQPRAEVVLPNRDRVRLTLDRDGLAITQLAGAERLAAVLFQANPNLASRMCAGLFSLETTPRPTPLRILVAAVLQLGSAEQVRNAFRDVAAQAR
jgi:hypothetical protein